VSGLRRLRPAWAGLAAVAALAGSLGCGLVLDLDPPEARHMECTATVENPEGVRLDVSSLNHPDFVRYVPSFAGGGGIPPGGGGATEPIRPYYVCSTATCGGCSFATPADAEADWRRWLEQRIGEIAAAPASASLFSMHAGPWCVVPGSLRCEAREIVDRDPECGAALAAGPMPDCTGAPPPGGRCLEVSCRGSAPCAAIDFGSQPTGARVSEVVSLRNCGDPTQLPFRIQVDPTVMPITLDADFSVARNGCAARDPMEAAVGRILQLPSVDPAEAACDFELAFAPTHGGRHEATITFSSDVDPGHRIRLLGLVEGGRLGFDVTGTVCFMPAAPGVCTAESLVHLLNLGPGAVTITDLYLLGGATNFRLLRPPPPPFPITLAPGAPPLEIALQWCPGGTDDSDAELIVESNSEPPLDPLRVRASNSADCM
jgi:hypothetical protein